MASILKIDQLNAEADDQIETAITALQDLFGNDRTTRDEALKVLIRRVLRKQRRNKTYGAL